MSLNLSKLLGVNVSTYENPEMDCMVDSMANDLQEIGVAVPTDKKLHRPKAVDVQGIWLVNIDDIECEDQLDFELFKADLGEQMRKAIERDVSQAHWMTLAEMFAKYWLEYDGMYFYTPKAYNYENDSLELRLKTKQEVYDLVALWLEELIMEYIKNERQESCDWYISLEPTEFCKVGIDDYCTLWAILKKEWVYDTIKEALQEYVNDGYSDLVYKHSDPRYMIRTPIGWEPPYELNYYTLDYDNKILLPFEEANDND